MGYACKVHCSECGYESNDLYLGRGVLSESEFIIGTCSKCNQITEALEGTTNSNCKLCKSKRSVTFTSFLTESNKDSDESSNVCISYQCPDCKELKATSVDIGGVMGLEFS
mgnify:CR=1 FL=1